MILEALTNHYRRLRDNGVIEPFPFRKQRISLCVVIKSDGTLVGEEDVRYEHDGRTQPLRLELPYLKTRTSGDWANFLWDNTGYVLGRDEKTKADKLKKRQKLFADLHDEMASRVDDEGLNAVCRFLAQWDPQDFDALGLAEELLGEQVVFRLHNQSAYVHESKSLRDLWRQRYEELTETVPRASLLTNERTEVCLTHPMIQGVAGTNTTGASIVSFNLSAFDSYHAPGNANAPLTPEQAFEYTTALNHLLADEKYRVKLGDTTCVFWTDRPETGAPDALAAVMNDPWSNVKTDAETQIETHSALQDFLERYQQGKDAPQADELEDAQAPFYVLGLSPNAARISVRFWMRCTVRELAERLYQHTQSLQIVGLRDDATPSLRQLIISTAREAGEIKPNIAGELTRAFLYGRSLPRSYQTTVLNRIRIDCGVTTNRAAGLKAYLLTHGIADMDIYLNKEHPSIAYHAGRTFAIVAFAQEQALPGVNASVIKKNFAAAMTTPGLTLGRLQRAMEIGHLHKLDDSLAMFIRDELAAANCCMLDGPNNNLSPDEQTLFALGFYQQTAYLRVVGGQVSKRHRHRSALGEWMRSKLEVKVANCLNKAGVKYIYEPSAILEDAGERWPDFVIRGGQDRRNDTYVEVAGYPGEEYDQRHRLKIEAYAAIDITQEGGEQGRLVVLDFRERDYDDKAVLDALHFLINSESPAASEES